MVLTYLAEALNVRLAMEAQHAAAKLDWMIGQVEAIESNMNSIANNFIKLREYSNAVQQLHPTVVCCK